MTSEPLEIRVAGTDSALPDELKKFFERGGSSLLIKGSAGSGKTTLALTLLRALNITENFLYVSTREAPIQFIRDNAWLAERYGGQVSASSKKQQDADPDSALLDGFVDARLDEPTQLFERITSKLMDASSPFIIIDTWDAMQDFGRESRSYARLHHGRSRQRGPRRPRRRGDGSEAEECRVQAPEGAHSVEAVRGEDREPVLFLHPERCRVQKLQALSP
jgi:energy-coupling factor transporter ATP-binding protein EcfA2